MTHNDLHTRAVLTDEIDADPVEPAPDEGLVERLATEAQLAFQSAGTWEAAVRAVLAEIERADDLTPVIHTHKKRVTELESQLATAK